MSINEELNNAVEEVKTEVEEVKAEAEQTAAEAADAVQDKAEELLDKVRKCWSSLFTPRAIYYRVTKGFEHSKVKLAVVVQKMINSEISGIMFTVDPNSEMPHIIIEAGYGLGEALVGGKVTPDTYVVDKFHDKILNKRIAKQTWKLVRGKDGECEKADVPEALRNVQKMSDEQILRRFNGSLGQAGIRAELDQNGQLIFSACKNAEDGRGVIVRLWNPHDQPAQERLRLWQDIASANGLANPNQIYGGQQLLIPGTNAPGTSAVAPPVRCPGSQPCSRTRSRTRCRVSEARPNCSSRALPARSCRWRG